MKTLTIIQPWATLIAIGAKRYETRSWRPPETLIWQRIGIHAGKVREPSVDMPTARQIGSALGIDGLWGGWPWPDLPRGALIATAVLAGVQRTGHLLDMGLVSDQERLLGDWSPDRWAWVLTRVRQLPEPIPMPGQQRLWNLKVEVEIHAD